MGEVAQLITAIATLLGVLLSIVLSLSNRRRLKTVEKQTNGMMKHLEASATAVGHAAGREEGRVEGEQRAADLIVSDAAKNA